jgi:hypothetical protein
VLLLKPDLLYIANISIFHFLNKAVVVIQTPVHVVYGDLARAFLKIVDMLVIATLGF